SSLYTLSLHDALPISRELAATLSFGRFLSLSGRPRLIRRETLKHSFSRYAAQYRTPSPVDVMLAPRSRHPQPSSVRIVFPRLRRSEEHTSELQSRFDL